MASSFEYGALHGMAPYLYTDLGSMVWGLRLGLRVVGDVQMRPSCTLYSQTTCATTFCTTAFRTKNVTVGRWRSSIRVILRAASTHCVKHLLPVTTSLPPGQGFGVLIDPHPSPVSPVLERLQQDADRELFRVRGLAR